MNQRPAIKNTWEMEIYKIKMRYHDSFEIIKFDDSNAFKIYITHYPTDPNFAHLIVQEGLLFQIDIMPSYFASESDSYQLTHATKLKTLNPSIESHIKAKISEVYTQIFCNLNQKYKIFNTLKVLETKLLDIFQPPIPEGKKEEKVHLPWSHQEQSNLEQGLVWYRGIKDPIQKWKKISEFVKSRSSKECALQFKLCKDKILQQQLKDNNTQKINNDAQNSGQSSAENCTDNEHTELKNNITILDNDQLSISNNNGLEISFSDLTLKNIAYAGLTYLRLQTICITCKKLSEMDITSENREITSNVIGKGQNCERCSSKFVLSCQPTFIFSNSNLAGFLNVEGAAILDILSCDCIVVCEGCSSTYSLKNLHSGLTKDITCRMCFAKMKMKIENITLINNKSSSQSSDDQIAQLISEFKRVKISSNSSKQFLKSALRSNILKKGDPLPSFGTCKHYKKSFRWFRFPCCGVTFPCDVCHDSNSDHPHEWAQRMICGYCSTEQSISEKPCSCGHLLIAKNTAHWEGGKGTRNKITMSRKDKHKYKNLSKNVK